MRKIIFLVAFLLLVGFIIKNSVFRPAENFHVVDEGKFYRMAQPTPDELDEMVKKYGIKTVVNLRGEQKGEWWYDDEASALQKLGVNMVNIGFSTEHMQFKDDWVKYADTLANAERPILVHCRSGADRTSEATAVYAIEFMGKSREQAIEDHMGLRYLHVPFFQPAKKQFIRNYEGMEWLKTAYDPCGKAFREHAGNRCAPERLQELLRKEANELPKPAESDTAPDMEKAS